MPKLLDAAGEVLADAGPALLAADAWSADSAAGLLIAADAEIADLPDDWQQAPLVAIEFPSFTDGRGLSLAVLLRTRCGYTGRLRANGDVILDLLHYMRRCGFDEFELREDQDVSACQAALQRGRRYYPASVIEPEPAYRRAAG